MNELVSRLKDTRYVEVQDYLYREDDVINDIDAMFKAIHTDPNYRYDDIESIVFCTQSPLIRIKFNCYATYAGSFKGAIPDIRVLLSAPLDFIYILKDYTELAARYIRNHPMYAGSDAANIWYMSEVLGSHGD